MVLARMDPGTTAGIGRVKEPPAALAARFAETAQGR